MGSDIKAKATIDYFGAMTAEGGVAIADVRHASAKRPHLSPLTKELLIVLAHVGAVDAESGISKRELAIKLGCCLKTIDRGLAQLRRTGMIVSRVRLDKTGAQLSSQHLVTLEARELFPELM